MMWWENMSHLNVEGMVQRGSWVMVDPGLLHQAIAKIRVNAEWGCGPNSSARAAILLNAHIGNWVWFVDHCPRTFGLPLGIPEPWWKVGPAPESLAEYLGKCSELHNFWPRSAGESDWNAMLAHFKHHLKGCRPVIVLLSLEMARQHYVCVVEIDESRQCAAVLNTDGALFEAPLDDLKNRMDATGTWGHLAHQFDIYNAIRFDFAVDRPAIYVERKNNMPLMPPKVPRPEDGCLPRPQCIIV